MISLHHETIYRYILADKKQGGQLYKCLRHQNSRYRKRYGSAHNRTGIPNRRDIDERQIKLRLAAPLTAKKAGNTAAAIISLLEPIKKFVKSITFDNGKEFSQHEKIARGIGCETYFAKPYHSWERGQNENANGLLRQYFPKKMKLNNISMSQVAVAVDKLNSRPRKCLNYRTPYEMFLASTGVDVRKILTGYAFIT